MLRKSIILGAAFVMLAAASFAQTKLIRQTRPTYPAEAKQAGVTGTVKLDATIAPDGRVQDVRVVSGPAVLADAAVAAVRQWVYEPITVDGTPVMATTLITLNFSLPGSIGIEDRIGAAHGINPVNQVRPVYPAEQKANGMSGTVKLRAVVSKEGTVKSLQTLSGEPVFVEAASEAIRQWRYEPIKLNGEPVDVLVDIVVNFRLAQ